MKSTELRSGNLVFNLMNQPIVADWSTVKYANDFTPIELTEDWLKKFGFEYTDGEDAYECIWALSGFELWQHDKGFCHSYIFGGEINHVHQLQNMFFALTGNELELI